MDESFLINPDLAINKNLHVFRKRDFHGILDGIRGIRKSGVYEWERIRRGVPLGSFGSENSLMTSSLFIKTGYRCSEE